MTHFLQMLLIGCLWIWGFNYLFKKKEILGQVGEYIRDHFPKWMVKPTIGCPACMASIHGTLIFFAGLSFHQFQYPVTYLPILFWPLYCICLVGINHIIIEHLYDTSE